MLLQIVGPSCVLAALCRDESEERLDGNKRKPGEICHEMLLPHEIVSTLSGYPELFVLLTGNSGVAGMTKGIGLLSSTVYSAVLAMVTAQEIEEYWQREKQASKTWFENHPILGVPWNAAYLGKPCRI